MEAIRAGDKSSTSRRRLLMTIWLEIDVSSSNSSSEACVECLAAVRSDATSFGCFLCSLPAIGTLPSDCADPSSKFASSSLSASRAIAAVPSSSARSLRACALVRNDGFARDEGREPCIVVTRLEEAESGAACPRL
eukprot:6210470-Pleurochrysis_carterae.AAC.1